MSWTELSALCTNSNKSKLSALGIWFEEIWRTLWGFRTSALPHNATARRLQKPGTHVLNPLSPSHFRGSNFFTSVRQAIVRRHLLYFELHVGRLWHFRSYPHILHSYLAKDSFYHWTFILLFCKVLKMNKSDYCCIHSRSSVFLYLLFRKSFDHVL